MNELALFAGAGGGLLAASQLGWRTRCAVEIDSYARKSLLARQRDGVLERFPIWDDITTFDGSQWKGSIDIISGGFPCQDISSEGKRAGIEGEKSGLWKHMARIVGQVRPDFVWVENSPMLVVRGLGTVIGDLSAMGYDCRWCIVGAHHAGANHLRNRIWILAYTNSSQFKRRRLSSGGEKRNFEPIFRRWWQTEPNVGRVVDGVADGVDKSRSNALPGGDKVEAIVPNRAKRLKAIGNGQVPAAMMIAWKTLTKDL
jgi:DNA (cytosine-5)-methyltransferase 1